MKTDPAMAVVSLYSVKKRRDAVYQALLSVEGSFPAFHAYSVIRAEFKRQQMDPPSQLYVKSFLDEMVSKGEMRKIRKGRNPDAARYMWVN